MVIEGFEQYVLFIRFDEGLSYCEMAFAIGKNQTNSRAVQHRALKALRIRLRHRSIANVQPLQ